MTTCPKCQYQRKPHDQAPAWQCPACSVAYNKVSAAQKPATDGAPPRREIGELKNGSKNTAILSKRNIVLLVCALMILLVGMGMGMVKAFNQRHALSPGAGGSALEAPASSSTHDFLLPGFQGLAWGARNDDIKARFGSQLSISNPPQRFHEAHANLGIENYNLDGVVMNVSFQMSNGNDQLFRVRLAKTTMSPTGQSHHKSYTYLLDQMTKKLGKPTCAGQFDCKWSRGDTVIELDYLYQANILENLTVMYKPASGL